MGDVQINSVCPKGTEILVKQVIQNKYGTFGFGVWDLSSFRLSWVEGKVGLRVRIGDLLMHRGGDD